MSVACRITSWVIIDELIVNITFLGSFDRSAVSLSNLKIILNYCKIFLYNYSQLSFFVIVNLEFTLYVVAIPSARSFHLAITFGKSTVPTSSKWLTQSGLV